MASLVEAIDLAIGFKDPLQEGLSFSLEKGEILLIKGRNGAGKSTLVKTLCRELPALKGNIRWGIHFDRVSILPQMISHEFPLSITLGEIIHMFDLKKSVRDFLPEHLHKRVFNDASGGERQKTLILTRLEEQTEFLILDEPFNHLDPVASKEVMSFIEELLKSKIIQGLILISHVDVDFGRDNIKEVVLS